MQNCVLGHRDNYTFYTATITGCLTKLYPQHGSFHWSCFTFQSCIHWEFGLLFVPALQVALFQTKILKC